MINPITPIDKYPDEEFMIIPPFSDNIKPYYIISNYGNIYNAFTGVKLIPHENENGYLQVSLMTQSGRVFRKVHRLVMMCFFYFPGCELYQVNHKNGVKTINIYWNLEWSTPKENIEHAINIGLRKPFKGEYNPNSSLTDKDARIIGEMIIAGVPDIEIANKICNGNINIVREIAYGRTWSHLFTEDEKHAIAISRKGNIISIENKHKLCKFYQENINNYTGYGKTSNLIKDALKFIGLDNSDDRIFRVAKRIFYRYESPEITSLYKY